MRKVYIAAKYADRERAAAFAKRLNEAGLGYKVISSWLHEKYDPQVQMAELTEDTLRGMSILDVNEVKSSDRLILFTESDTSATFRNGRLVELGVALGSNLPVMIIGPHENIFCHHPLVCQAVDEDHALRLAAGW